jgi:hypothetical protein
VTASLPTNPQAEFDLLVTTQLLRANAAKAGRFRRIVQRELARRR